MPRGWTCITLLCALVPGCGGKGGAPAPDGPVSAGPDGAVAADGGAGDSGVTDGGVDTDGGGDVTMTFEVAVPSNTPPEDVIFFHSGRLDLPMERTGPATWRLALARAALAPAAFDGVTLGYAYTRDALGYYGGELLAGDPAQVAWGQGRSAAFGSRAVSDRVTRWRFSPAEGEELPALTATTRAFVPRVAGWTFQPGIEIADYWPGTDDGPPAYVEATSQAIERTHARWVQLAPPWNYEQLFPHPIIKNDRALIPGYPDADLRAHIRNLRAHGFKVMLRIQVCCTGPTEAELTGIATAWFDEWFAQYDAFVRYHAQLAADEGVDAILLDWSGNLMLPDAPTAPADAAARWAALLDHARAVFPGQLGYDLLTLGSGDPGAPPWPFSQLGPLARRFDFFGIAMWGPLATRPSPTQADLDGAVAALFAGTFASVTRATGKPVIISGLAYGSYAGAALAGLPESDPGFSAAFGREASATLPYDGLEQAMIVQAVMANVATTPAVVGVYPFHYNWVALPKDVGWSLRGKAGEAVLAGWYASIR